MDGGRRRCRWGVAGGAAAEDNSRIMNTVMLRFRPIAPKPTPIPGGESLPAGFNSNQKAVSYRRQKRKYVRVSSSKNKRGVKTTPVDNRQKKIVTLQLLPDDEEGKVHVDREGKNRRLDLKVHQHDSSSSSSTWLNFDNTTTTTNNNNNNNNNIITRRYEEEEDDNSTKPRIRSPDRTAAMRPMGYIECWVIAESVMDPCMERVVVSSIGCTDEEMIRNLDQDTCPGFVSNGCNMVEWVNQAFKGTMMMAVGGGEFPAATTELVVWLVIKGKVMPYLDLVSSSPTKTTVFTCRVRLVQNTCGKERFSMILPCDTWRMDSGRFAWRLDVKAALSLGSFNLKPCGGK